MPGFLPSPLAGREIATFSPPSKGFVTPITQRPLDAKLQTTNELYRDFLDWQLAIGAFQFIATDDMQGPEVTLTAIVLGDSLYADEKIIRIKPDQ
jgi:hypothetical protein